MPSMETLERFVARVEQNAHAEACEEFYTETSSMQENQSGGIRIGAAISVRRQSVGGDDVRVRLADLLHGFRNRTGDSALGICA